MSGLMNMKQLLITKRTQFKTLKINLETLMPDIEKEKPQVPNQTAQLLQEEHLQMLHEQQMHQKVIGEFAMKVEALLLETDFTWGEWGEVVDLINKRTGAVVHKLPIKFIKEKYDRDTLGGGTSEKSGS